MAGRILIADEVATNRIIQKVKLSAAHYEVLQAADAATLLETAARERPDLILMSTDLPGASLEEVVRLLHGATTTRAVPVVALSNETGARARIDALKAGCDDVLVRPVQEQPLLALIRNLIRSRVTFEELSLRKDIARDFGLAEEPARFTAPARVVLIAPTPEEGVAWRQNLSAGFHGRIETVAGLKGFDPTADGHAPPDAFVIAATRQAPGDGLGVVSELRSQLATRNAAILVAIEPDCAHQAALALDMGADGVLQAPVSTDELALRLEARIRRKQETDRLRRLLDRQLDLALRDPLTGLYNRRYAQTYLAHIARTARETGQPFALMLLDLDRFKAVNDRYGHAAGDEVLVEVAARLRANLREIDLLARLGGEEFLVAMPETDRSRAAIAAERLRRLIGETPVRSDTRGQDIVVTMSIGVAMADGASAAAEVGAVTAMIDRADKALYAAKAEGRNQVTFTRPAA